jgi:hypothetical protein
VYSQRNDARFEQLLRVENRRRHVGEEANLGRHRIRRRVDYALAERRHPLDAVHLDDARADRSLHREALRTAEIQVDRIDVADETTVFSRAQ